MFIYIRASKLYSLPPTYSVSRDYVELSECDDRADTQFVREVYYIQGGFFEIEYIEKSF